MRPDGEGERDGKRQPLPTAAAPDDGERCPLGAKSPLVSRSDLAPGIFDVDLRRRCEELFEAASCAPEEEPLVVRDCLVDFEDLVCRSSMVAVASSGDSGVAPIRWCLVEDRVTGPKYPSFDSKDSDPGGVGEMTRGVEGMSLREEAILRSRNECAGMRVFQRT